MISNRRIHGAIAAGLLASSPVEAALVDYSWAGNVSPAGADPWGLGGTKPFTLSFTLDQDSPLDDTPARVDAAVFRSVHSASLEIGGVSADSVSTGGVTFLDNNGGASRDYITIFGFSATFGGGTSSFATSVYMQGSTFAFVELIEKPPVFGTVPTYGGVGSTSGSYTFSTGGSTPAVYSSLRSTAGVIDFGTFSRDEAQGLDFLDLTDARILGKSRAEVASSLGGTTLPGYRFASVDETVSLFENFHDIDNGTVNRTSSTPFSEHTIFSFTNLIGGFTYNSGYEEGQYRGSLGYNAADATSDDRALQFLIQSQGYGEPGIGYVQPLESLSNPILPNWSSFLVRDSNFVEAPGEDTVVVQDLGGFDGGDLGGFVPEGPGTADVVTSPVAGDEGNNVVKFTTGSPIAISQQIDTPDSSFWIVFDYLFGTTAGDGAGPLEVFLNDSLLASILAPETLADQFITYNLLADNPAWLGLQDATLSFRFDGDTGSTLYQDNIAILAADVSYSYGNVPEPASILLAGIGLLGIGAQKIRKRSGVQALGKLA